MNNLKLSVPKIASFLVLFVFSAQLLMASDMSVPTPDMGRIYHFFTYLAKGVPSSGYDASPYLPEGMNGIGFESAQMIWLRARQTSKVEKDNLTSMTGATLRAASQLYGEDSAAYVAVTKAWKALNVATATITITNPAGGEYWAAGSKHTIRWTYSGNPGSTVKIVLTSGIFVPEVTLTNSTSIGSGGIGSFIFRLPCDLDEGNYRIHIVSNSDSSIFNYSQIFIVVRQTVTVTTPAGGENWRVGTTHTIKWSATGDIGPTVKLMAKLTSRLYWYEINDYAPSGANGSGSYSWTIPSNTQTGTYSIWLFASCGDTADASAVFNITP